MINFVYKCYLIFPPITRKALDFSIRTFMGGITVDYYHSDVESMFIGCKEVTDNFLKN